MTYGKVLLVGAGGLGCELIRNFSTADLEQLTILDPDTIDITNLNRQSLYSLDTIGKLKCEVAAEAYKKLANNENVLSYNKKIQDVSLAEIKKYHIVCSALDNIIARQYLSSLCIEANIPLIEGGSTGYNGQAYIIWSLCETECYACKPKKMAQSIPLCTIRNYPTSQEHCIAWAKEIYKILFINNISDTNDFIDIDIIAIRKEKNMDVQKNKFIEFFNKLFFTSIIELNRIKFINNTNGNEACKVINAYDYDLKIFDMNELMMKYGEDANNEHEFLAANMELKDITNHLYINFLLCLQYYQTLKLNDSANFRAIFRFIYYLSILRMHCFNIQSATFENVITKLKKIQPAISSTNSIVAGVQSLYLEKILYILRNNLNVSYELLEQQNLNFVWVALQNNNPIIVDKIDMKSPNCLVCNSHHNLLVLEDFDNKTISDLCMQLKKLCNNKDVELIQTSETIVYDIDLTNNPSSIKLYTVLKPDETINVIIDETSYDFIIITESNESGITIDFNAKSIKLQNWESSKDELSSTKSISDNDSSDSNISFVDVNTSTVINNSIDEHLSKKPKIE